MTIKTFFIQRETTSSLKYLVYVYILFKNRAPPQLIHNKSLIYHHVCLLYNQSFSTATFHKNVHKHM